MGNESGSEDYKQAYLPELIIPTVEDQERFEKQIDEEYPDLRNSFGSILSTMFYFNNAKELGGSTREFPLLAEISVLKGKHFQDMGMGTNSTNSNKNSLDHAEKVAIEAVLKKTGNKHLPPGSVLITPIEPCSMCAGAFYHANGDTIIYSVSQKEMQNTLFNIDGQIKPFRTEPEGYKVEDFLRDRNPRIKVIGGYGRFQFLNYYNNWRNGKTANTFSLHEDV